MSVEWNDIFKLPDAALAGGKRVPKTVLARNGNLSRLEQRTLDAVSRLEHYATVQKSTTRIPPHVDDERDIESVIFLRCELTGRSAAYAELACVLHACFPNPTVLLLENGDEICMSCSVTRMSLAERGATVVESAAMTGRFVPRDTRYAPMLAALAFEALPQEDLFFYVQELSWSLRLGRLVDALGFYPVCEPTDREHLLELSTKRDALAAEQNRIVEQRRDKNLTLNESAKLRMKLREIEKGIKGTLDEIADLSV